MEARSHVHYPTNHVVLGAGDYKRQGGEILCRARINNQGFFLQLWSTGGNVGLSRFLSYLI